MGRSPVLITGATGFVGRALMTRLLRDGLPVRAAVRCADSSLPYGVERIVTGELGNDSSWHAAVQNASAVVHCAARAHILKDEASDPLAAFRAANRDATASLALQAATNGVSRFLFVSSLGVNGNETFSRPFLASDPPAPVSPYAVAKHEAEMSLHAISEATQMEMVIVRPPLVYGAQAPGNFARLLRAANSGMPLPFGAIRNRRSFVFIENLVDLLVTALRHPAAPGGTFLVSDGEDLSTTDLVRRLRVAMGRRPRLLPVPGEWVRTATRLAGMPELGQRLCGSLQADIDATLATLDWRPPISVDAALMAAAQQFLFSCRQPVPGGNHNRA